MKQQWLKLLAAIDARSLRERVLIMAALIALVVVMADTTFISPARKAQQNDAKRSSQVQLELGQLDQQIAQMQTRGRLDPNVETLARLNAIEQEVVAQRTRLAGAVEQFITPSEMNRVLHALVSSTTGLSLQGLRSLPPESLSRQPDDAAPAQDESDTNILADGVPTIWRRGAEIELSGDYNALLTYIRAIEAMPWRLNWDSLTIVSDSENGAPQRFVLRLHTLSLSEEWIGAY